MIAKWETGWKKRLAAGMAAVLLATAGLVPGGATRADAANAPDLFFSEYVEGSDNNKAIEIYNGTGQAVNPGEYTVELYSNGRTTVTSKFALDLKGNSLASGGVYVIAHESAIETVKSVSDATSDVANFNGDDVLLLKHNGTVIDSFGKLGEDPGTNWGGVTSEKTLVRKSSVYQGDADASDSFDPLAEWDVYDQNTFSYLGSHTMDGGEGVLIAPTASPAPGVVKAGTEVTLSTPTVSATVYYSVYAANDSVLVPERPYTEPIAVDEDVTIRAYSQDGEEKSDVKSFAYQVAATIPISEARSLEVNSQTNIEGVVTYKETSGGQNNLYVQDGTAGIVVRGANLAAEPGDRITALGKITDYYGLAQLQVSSAGDVVVTGEGEGVPEPAAIGADTDRESVEGMLVKLEGAAVGEGNSYNEFKTTGAYGELIVKSPLLKTGERYDLIVGVLTYSFGNYMLVPRNALDVIGDIFSVQSDTPSGIVPNGHQVKLSTAQPDGKIYYTLDGGVPTEATGTFYAAPITIIADEVVVKAIVVAGGETSEVFTFTYEVQQEHSGLRIHDIQSASHESPYVGHKVIDVEGIVTQRANGKIYIQEETDRYDEDDRTSEAIAVVSAYGGVAVGDKVQVDGTVAEIAEEGYEDADDLKTTAIISPFITKVSSGHELPTPVVLGQDRKAPTTVIDNDGFAVFDPEEDALDFYESLESMRLELRDARVVGPYDFEIPVVLGEQSDPMTPNGGIILTGEDLNPQKILVQRANNAVKTGDRFDAPIIGILGYDYSNYKVIPEKALPSVTAGSTSRETTSIQPDEDKLTIAGFNIENFWNNPSDSGQEKKGKIAEAIVGNLKSPDIIGLIEVQDDDGEKDSGQTDAKQNYEALIQAIEEAGGPAYSYTDIAPVNNADGGAPGGNIRVGYLYNAERVSLANKPRGDATTAVRYNGNGLTLNPGRIDPANAAFGSSRKPLAAEFEFKGERIVVINNHFNSKGGDEAPYGATQPLPETLGSEVQRHQIAAIVNGFVQEILDKNPDANVVLLGDFNDFQFSRTMDILKGDELVNKVDSLPVNERYSYVYQGNSQTLDHMLVNRELASEATLDIVHINADFNESHGRVSDHDPLLLQVDLDGGSPGHGHGGNGGNNGGGNAPDPVDPGETVTVEVGSDAIKTSTDGQGRTVTTVTVKPEQLIAAVREASGGTGRSKKIVVEAEGAGGIVQVKLPAVSLEGAPSDLIISAHTRDGSYELPVSVVDLAELAGSLAVREADLILSVNIEALSDAEEKAVAEAIQRVGGAMQGAPLRFAVIAEGGGKSAELNAFGTTYVARTITLDQAVDGSEATAVEYDPATKTVVFVPSTFETSGGRTVATIKRNGNSVYAVAAATRTFDDLANHWSKADVELLASKWIVQGQTETRFAPNSPVTRAEFAALLVRSLGLREEAAEGAFSDVGSGDWFSGAVGAASKAGVIEGFEDGTFRPDERITREQIAVMTVRAMAAAGQEPEGAATDLASAFADGGGVSAWAAEAVAANAELGLMQGANGRIRPADSATRAEAATMLKRLLQHLAFID